MLASSPPSSSYSPAISPPLPESIRSAVVTETEILTSQKKSPTAFLLYDNNTRCIKRGNQCISTMLIQVSNAQAFCPFYASNALFPINKYSCPFHIPPLQITLHIGTQLQYPLAPGAFSSFRNSTNNSLNRSLPVPLAPPFVPLPLRSTSFAIRSQLVPPAEVSSRLARNSSASLREREIDFSFLEL